MQPGVTASGARAGVRSWLILPLNGDNKVRWDRAGTAIDVSLE